jgi:ABC-type multidrug transport system ATPase subunit
MSSEPVLQAINLSKRYNTRWAVHELNLTVLRGEIFGFLGPNGAGKSTSIRMFLSLVRPTDGQVELFGKPLHRNRSELLARVGGLVERADFYLYLSARRNLEIVAALAGVADPKKIDAVLETVGLRARAEDKVKTFSHGMRQRLGLAQALLGDPELIILDEPTTGLDPMGIKEVRDLIAQLSKERGITVFLSSHLLSEIEQTATSMAIINAGKLVVQGRVKELLEEGEGLVRIDARPLDQALRILSEHQLATSVTRAGDIIEARMPSANVPAVARLLVEGGVDVRALIPRRSLEEYFLSLTEQAVVPGKGSLK